MIPFCAFSKAQFKMVVTKSHFQLPLSVSLFFLLNVIRFIIFKKSVAAVRFLLLIGAVSEHVFCLLMASFDLIKPTILISGVNY